MDTAAAILRLRELLRCDEAHIRSCSTNDPVPFPCDCEMPNLLRLLLDGPRPDPRQRFTAIDDPPRP